MTPDTTRNTTNTTRNMAMLKSKARTWLAYAYMLLIIFSGIFLLIHSRG